MTTLFEKIVDGRRLLIPHLLDAWDNALRELEAVMGTVDLPYVYRERASVGILAAAATKLGYLTLEEYSVHKWQGRKRRQGRADLWICSRDGSKEFNIEAKHEVISVRTKSLPEIIRPHLEDAVTDVRPLRPCESAHSIGILFLRFYGARPDEFDPVALWKKLRNRASYDGDFCALHICEFEIWSQQEKHNDCPGIALLGRYLRH